MNCWGVVYQHPIQGGQLFASSHFMLHKLEVRVSTKEPRGLFNLKTYLPTLASYLPTLATYLAS